MTAPALSISTEHGRMYRHPGNGHKVPSITNITGMKDKPALKFWAAKEAGWFAAKNLDVLNMLKDEKARADLVKGAPFRKSGDAAERGDDVHALIEEHIRHGRMSLEQWSRLQPGSQRMMRQFYAIEERYKPQWKAAEFTVWSYRHNYAGTADWSALINPVRVQPDNPRGWPDADLLALGDTKTGKNAYPEVGMQLAAIAGADVMIRPDGTEVKLPEFKLFYTLHVRPTFAELVPARYIDECFEAFLALRKVWQWDVDYSNRVLEYAPHVQALPACSTLAAKAA